MKALFVAIGPGTFNGVRVALSTAKGIAFGLNVPLVGVSTMEAEAQPFLLTRLDVCPVHKAGKNEVAWARYKLEAGESVRLIDEHISAVDEICDQTVSETVFCGELHPELVSVLKERLGDLAIIPNASTRLRRPGYVAAIGWRRLSRGQSDDICTLQPLYLRRPHITIPKGSP